MLSGGIDLELSLFITVTNGGFMKARINTKCHEQRLLVVYYLNKTCRIINVSMTKPEQLDATRPMIKF